MNVILWLMLFLFVSSIIFQIREIFYISKYEKPDNDDIECHYRYKYKKKNGHTDVECKNKFYCNSFKKKAGECPKACKGRRYPGINDSFEMMSSTDMFYCVKSMLFLVGSIFSVLLTILNLLDRM